MHQKWLVLFVYPADLLARPTSDVILEEEFEGDLHAMSLFVCWAEGLLQNNLWTCDLGEEV